MMARQRWDWLTVHIYCITRGQGPIPCANGRRKKLHNPASFEKADP